MFNNAVLQINIYGLILLNFLPYSSNSPLLSYAKLSYGLGYMAWLKSGPRLHESGVLTSGGGKLKGKALWGHTRRTVFEREENLLLASVLL